METLLKQKITAEIPKKLLDDARKVTGKGITKTITEGLERLSKDEFYQKMLSLRGSCKLDIDLGELREDREF